MSQPTSSEESSKPSPRHWTPAAKKRVLAYLAKHGHAKTIAKYKISSSQLWEWKKGITNAEANRAREEKKRVAVGEARAPIRNKVPLFVYTLARSVRRGAIHVLGNPGDKETAEELAEVALLLARRVMKGDDH